MKNKLKVLFVGGFKESNGGVTGGQLHACSTLIKSDISSKVEFFLLDSTMISLPPPPKYIRIFFSLKRMLNFIYILFSKKPDTVLIFTSAGLSFIEKGLMVLVASAYRSRVVLSPRSGLLIDDINNSKFMRLYVYLIFKSCDRIICQSLTWKNYYADLTGFPHEKFEVIKNWLDSFPYQDLPPRQEVSYPIQVLYLGWVEKNKGIYDLIEAVKKNPILQFNFHFIICGQGSEFNSANQHIEDNGLSDCFQFKGWVSSEKKLFELHNADILVMPSHREGLPNALLEGMASGCCVVASSVGAIPDVIEDSKNGFLFERFNINQLSNILNNLQSSPHLIRQTGVHARHSIKENHDIRNVWKKVYEILLPDR